MQAKAELAKQERAKAAAARAEKAKEEQAKAELARAERAKTWAQTRAAKAQEDLAKAAKVGLATIQRIEQTDGVIQANYSTVLKLQTTLEKAGIQFIDEDSFVGVKVARKRL